MPRKPYPTDLSDQQWHMIESLVPASKPGGRPRTVDMREILNAIFYILGERLWLADVASRLPTLVYSLLLRTVLAFDRAVACR